MVIVTVYIVPAASEVVGVNTTVRVPTVYTSKPAGAAQGTGHVTTKDAAVIVAGTTSSVNSAEIATLVGTPVVGPGVVVAGTVDTTRGRVASVVAPVVNCQVNGAASDTPVAMLVAPVMVTVYRVSGDNIVPAAKV